MSMYKSGFPNARPAGKMTSSKPKIEVQGKEVNGEIFYYAGTNNLYEGDPKAPYKDKTIANMKCHNINIQLSKK
ncbi:hypothetical protein M8D54_005099 [Salmonella enterica]|nr:hypothetical protein [Salmonella enterica]EGR6194752.1 hypothetical protein [Salmonella enterica]EHR7428665.1 hypothetical protein [Salmonella enterica]EJF2005683.1 hypothetical protein [Salmonella enterica]EJF2493250.1 hypothetical protein [Salmonella enterica]